jgi:ABC-2 type transport system permease protein
LKKILVVAKSEFLTSVRSKGFIIGVMLLPILMGISIAVQTLSSKHVDVTARTFAVVDETGQLYDVLAAKAEERNRSIDANSGAPQAKFIPVRSEAAESRPSDELRLELSDKIRSGEIFAFVEIPTGVLNVGNGPGSAAKIAYYSDKPTDEDLRNWIANVLNQELLQRRFAAVNLTMEDQKRLTAVVPSEHRGLASRKASGAIQGPAKVDKMLTQGIPAILMFLLWMVVMSAAPQLLNSAIEEKMIRISEVMLGCVSPFELMMGKLLASAGVASLLAMLYLGGGMIVAHKLDHSEWVPYSLLPFFALFMLLAVLFFGSVFIAIGAACSELKDAQGLMAPAMIILMLPVFIWLPVLKNPDSTLAVVASLFPPATPMLMLLRVSTHPSPPAWQVILSILLTSATTIACVWAAGKIFRIGMLSQGKTPSFREMIRWVRSG